ncbi:MAG: hypothetical protein AB1560_11670, partial [Pseudomonadota bacterium]
MKNNIRRSNRLLTVACINKFAYFILALLSMSVLPVESADKYWVCGSDSWDNGSCWSAIEGGAGGAGQPQDSESVYLTQSGSIDRTVSYINALYPNAVLNELRIDSSGTGKMVIEQSSDSLFV